MLWAENNVLIDAAKRDVVKSQDRIAAVKQKPAPIGGQLACEALRAAIPGAAMGGRHKWLAGHLGDQPIAFMQTGHGRLSVTPER